MKRRIRVAFQGGGARVAALLPVVQALIEREQDGDIEITATAGSSAGSIAAVLLAANANIGALRQYLSTINVDVLHSILPPTPNTLIQKFKVVFQLFFRRRPIVREKVLLETIKELMNVAGVPETLGKLKRQCYIIASDLGGQGKAVFDNTSTPEIQIARAIADSCGLPFIHKTPLGAFNSHLVDGGLLDNLPAEELIRNSDEEYIIAITFKQDSFVHPGETLLQYMRSLIDAAITYKTKTTKNLIGDPNVLELETNIEMFDASCIKTVCLDEVTFREKVDSFHRQFDKWERKTELNALFARKTPQQRIEYLEGKFRQLTSQFAGEYNIKLNQLEVIARCLTADHSKRPLLDEVISQLHVEPRDDQKLEALWIRLTAHNAGMQEDVELSVLDSANQKVPHVAVPLVDETAKLTWIAIFFTPALHASVNNENLYKIILKQNIRDFMRPLRDDNRDFLSLVNLKALNCEKMRIILCVPQVFPNIYSRPGENSEIVIVPDDNSTETHEITVSRRDGIEVKEFVYEGCPHLFRSHIWECNDVKKNERVTVIYTV